MNLAMISPFQLVIIGTLLTFVISDDRDPSELNVLGNLVVAVGSLVLTVAAQKELLKNKNEKKIEKEEIRMQIVDLQEKYKKIKC
jgi:hypothetical protein